MVILRIGAIDDAYFTGIRVVFENRLHCLQIKGAAGGTLEVGEYLQFDRSRSLAADAHPAVLGRKELREDKGNCGEEQCHPKTSCCLHSHLVIFRAGIPWMPS